MLVLEPYVSIDIRGIHDPPPSEDVKTFFRGLNDCNGLPTLPRR